MLGSYERAMVDQHSGAPVEQPEPFRPVRPPLCGECRELCPEAGGGCSCVEPDCGCPYRRTPAERLVASVTESYERHSRANRAEQALARILAASIEGGRTDRDRLRAVWAVLAEVGYEPHRPAGGGS